MKRISDLEKRIMIDQHDKGYTVKQIVGLSGRSITSVKRTINAELDRRSQPKPSLVQRMRKALKEWL